jgi:hypothetical protein
VITLAPHLAMATVLAASHLSYVRSSAAVRMASQAAGGTALMVGVLVIAVLTAVASALRGLAALLSELLRAATSILFTLVITVIVAVALLTH